jgi:hypothetical protein
VRDAAEAAGALDLLLTDAALGAARRFRPDSSLLRLGTGLARRPRLVTQQAARLGTELGRIAAGRSTVTAGPRDRRFSDPAWEGNPFLRRAVQAYLAAGQSAEVLLAGAGLGWRDETRLRFLLTNLIAAAAPSNNPLLSPVGWKALLDTGRPERHPGPGRAGPRSGHPATSAVHGARRRLRSGEGPGRHPGRCGPLV